MDGTMYYILITVFGVTSFASGWFCGIYWEAKRIDYVLDAIYGVLKDTNS